MRRENMSDFFDSCSSDRQDLPTLAGVVVHKTWSVRAIRVGFQGRGRAAKLIHFGARGARPVNYFDPKRNFS